MGHQAQDGARSESEESRLDRLESRLDKLVALLETMVAGAPETGPPSAAAALTPDSLLSASERKADIIRPTSFPKARALCPRNDSPQAQTRGIFPGRTIFGRLLGHSARPLCRAL
ncbi:hypothetical protein V6U71_18215 [Sphingopyxis sp. J-6]|uniref:hypothetical protein n=1 Tax=Sphingopyxis sp. J-6 TaxID=3122054 RepID=UPI003983E06A